MVNDLFSKWKDGLRRTRKAAIGRLTQLVGASQITSETWEELEGIFLQSDLGVETTEAILGNLKKTVQTLGITKNDELQSVLREELISRLITPEIPIFTNKPTVILIVGVNGSGKTTTIAKLAALYSRQNKRVMMIAADTFRAAATDQLQIWGERIKIPVIIGQANSDPGAVAYDGIQAALSRKMDIVLVDTAGRLQTRYNLMEELKKVHRVLGKALPGAPHLTWLVLDATTGQNALQQARAFKQAVNINGVILAKLDSSARGGMAFAIQKELDLPILYAGLGEKLEDLQPFDKMTFVEGILSTN